MEIIASVFWDADGSLSAKGTINDTYHASLFRLLREYIKLERC